MDHYNVLIRPLFTEKTTIHQEKNNQFAFEVNPRANRVEIRRAVEAIFDVRVSGVRTLHVKGKVKRRGMIWGKRKDWKKAVVKLPPGARIEIFEGA